MTTTVTSNAVPFCARCGEPFTSGQPVVQAFVVGTVKVDGMSVIGVGAFSHIECPTR